MKKSLFLLSLVYISILNNVDAQIRINSNQLEFAATNELSTDSQKLVIYNDGQSNLTIKEFWFFNTYSTKAFSSNFNEPQILAGGDSLVMYIRFNPRHNILHQSTLYIKTIPSIYSLSINLKGQGKYSKTYYANTENKSDDELKLALKNQITSGYVSLGYNVARDRMYMDIDNQKNNGQGASVNTLECVYTTRKAIDYTSRSDAQTGDNFNTEHTFPQGFFNDAEPMRSDLHHLFPTDNPANNSRGNLPFGVASTPYVDNSINAPSRRGSNGRYEPHDGQKGKSARAMMYFILRYQDYSNFFSGQETVLKEWHQAFPPNTVEQKRNNDINIYQKNRNPFIDYPQFIERINKLIGVSTPLSISGIYRPDSFIVSIADTSSAGIGYDLNMSNSGNTTLKLYDFISDNPDVIYNSANDTITSLAGTRIAIPVMVNFGDSVGNFKARITFKSNQLIGNNFADIYYSVYPASGLNSKNQQRFFNLYPNPASNLFNVQSSEEAYYIISDVLGKTLMSGLLNKGNNNIDVSSYGNGVYFLKAKTKNGISFTEKLLIRK